MAFSFRDNFTGGAVSSNALVSHTPDVFIDSVKLYRSAGSNDGLSGTGILYDSSGTAFTYPTVRLQLNTTGPTTVASPLTMLAEAVQGWTSGNASAALPITNSAANFGFLYTPASGSQLILTLHNRSSPLVVAEGLTNYGYTIPAGLSATLTCNTIDRGEVALGFALKRPTYVAAIAAAEPFDIKLTCTSTRAAVRVAGVLLFETDELTIGDPSVAPCYWETYVANGHGVSALVMNSDTLGPGSLNFWTGFVEMAETQ